MKNTLKAERMEIQVRTKCKSCSGQGKIYNPIYNDLYQAEQAAGGFTNEEYEQWFIDRGYSHPPSEELHCEDCDGTGMTIRWMDIQEVLCSKCKYRGLPDSINEALNSGDGVYRP